MSNKLPSSTLHRFPGLPRQGRDVDLYEKDGVTHVGSSSKGVSFLQLNDGAASAAAAVHARFRGQCFVTAPDAALSSGFEMKATFSILWPPQQKGVPRQAQHPRTTAGQHYALIPLVDMPLADYTAEIDRLKSLPCAIKAAAQPAAIDYDVLEPSDGLMVLVAMALQQLSEAPDEPQSVQSAAWVHYTTICALDMTFQQLLQEPGMASWALSAMETFDPPDDDLVTESACWHIEQELRVALDCSVITQVGLQN